MRTAFICPALASLVLASGSLAWAQHSKEDQAKVQYQRGIELFEAEMFEQAAIAFRKAYELRPSYRLLFNVAQAENSANRFAAALWAYDKYLFDGGSEIPESRVEQVKGEIERLNGLVGTVLINGGPDGAEVYVDRELVGELPVLVPLYVDLGRREMVVEHKGRRILERLVTVAGGERVVLDLRAGPAEETPEEAPATDTPAAESDGPSEELASSKDASDGPRRLWTWVAAGMGGAAAVGAGITGGMAQPSSQPRKPGLLTFPPRLARLFSS